MTTPIIPTIFPPGFNPAEGEPDPTIEQMWGFLVERIDVARRQHELIERDYGLRNEPVLRDAACAAKLVRLLDIVQAYPNEIRRLSKRCEREKSNG